MSKYSEIVAQENNSLNQQVTVLNELLMQRDEELSLLKTDILRNQAIISTQAADLLVLDSLRCTLEQEKRMRAQMQREITDMNIMSHKTEVEYQERVRELETSLDETLDQLA